MRTALALALCAAVAGCTLARRVPEIRYYVLAVPGRPLAGLAAPVRVDRFAADQAYAGARLAYRVSPYRVEYATYHRWASDPRRMVAAAARDYLARGAEGSGEPPYVLDGYVRRLEEAREGERHVGALGLDVRVRRDGQVVLERSFDEVEPVEGRDTEALAAALSRALGRILDAVVRDLAAAPVESPPGRPGALPAPPGARQPAR